MSLKILTPMGMMSNKGDMHKTLTFLRARVPLAHHRMPALNSELIPARLRTCLNSLSRMSLMKTGL